MKLRNVSVNYIGAIKPDICEKIISLGLSKIDLAKREGISIEGKTPIQREKKEVNIRKSEVIGLNEKWIYEIFTPMLIDANKHAGWNWQINSSENMQFAIYHGSKENGGFYDWHIDGASDLFSAYRPAIKISNDPLRFKPPKRNEENVIVLDSKGQPEADENLQDLPLINNGLNLNPKFSDVMSNWGKIRKISMTVNLSDPKKYEGGNLKLDLGFNETQSGKERYKVCTDIRPQGSVVFFPSFNYHCVTPVTSGTRYSLVSWFLGKPWQ